MLLLLIGPLKFCFKHIENCGTSTNGKSTTTHMIHKILLEAGYTAHTNTDSESEFNTLIDPMVAKQRLNFRENWTPWFWKFQFKGGRIGIWLIMPSND